MTSRTPRRNTQQGFTMVELLIVGLIVALVVGGMTTALANSGSQIWLRTDAQMTTLTTAQQALDRISEDLHRRATQASLACTTDQITFGPVGGGAAVAYVRTALGDLIRAEGAANQTLATGLNAFAPTCAPGGLVRLQVTTQVTVPGGLTAQQQLHSQVWVQNP
jgi:type II secretory pathway pseudopilin PulG